MNDNNTTRPMAGSRSDAQNDAQPDAERNPEMDAALALAVDAVQQAGDVLLERFGAQPIPARGEDVVAAIRANDEASLDVLRGLLEKARPGAGWVEDELEDGALPAGEWWVTDPVEGNINHVHGMTDWGVSATLVRDNVPVLTAVHLPVTSTTYTGLAGGGAFVDGVPLTVSAKTELEASLVGTGQARPGEDAETFRRMGLSLTVMLDAALVTRVSVPATLQLVQVAAGRMEAFWQFSAVRSGLLAGALLVAEAGGRVSDIHGRDWTLQSKDFLAAAPGVHTAAVDALAAVE